MNEETKSLRLHYELNQAVIKMAGARPDIRPVFVTYVTKDGHAVCVPIGNVDDKLIKTICKALSSNSTKVFAHPGVDMNPN